MCVQQKAFCNVQVKQERLHRWAPWLPTSRIRGWAPTDGRSCSAAGGASLGMLPVGGDDIWGNCSWAPDDDDRIREKGRTRGCVALYQYVFNENCTSMVFVLNVQTLLMMMIMIIKIIRIIIVI